MRANPRGKVTCSSAHTGNGLTHGSREQATTQKTWLHGVLLLVSKASACASLTVLYKWKGELDGKVERGNSTRILPETGHAVLNAMKNGV